jgi:MoaA/NifB/PqqE/SkfB family radical SAM enzyme
LSGNEMRQDIKNMALRFIEKLVGFFVSGNLRFVDMEQNLVVRKNHAIAAPRHADHVSPESRELMMALQNYWDSWWALDRRGATSDVYHVIPQGSFRDCLSRQLTEGRTVNISSGRSPDLYSQIKTERPMEEYHWHSCIQSRRVPDMGNADAVPERRIIDDIYRLPFDDDAIDNILVTFVLQSVFYPERAYRELVRVCKPGGAIVAIVPNGNEDGCPVHVNFWGPESFATFAGPMGVTTGFVDSDSKAVYVVVRKDFRKYLPRTFSIEPILSCNLRCPECHIGGGRIERRGRPMTFQKYKILADRIQPFATYVNLHLWGEPLLNKDIFEMIRYTARFATVNISTNANLLTERMAEDLILSGVRHLIVSIDGATQKTYAKYRVGGDLSRVLEALGWLTKYNHLHGKRVRIVPQFVVFRHNEHEIEDFRQLCSSYGLVPSFKKPYVGVESRFAHSRWEHYRRKRVDDVAEFRCLAATDCRSATDTMTIMVDGSVGICCYDSNGEMVFGNVFEQNVLEIWHSPACERARYNIFVGSSPVFCTENCLLYERSPGKWDVDVLSAGGADVKARSSLTERTLP